MILLLLRHKVEFMIVGGYAVIFHGYARTTLDMNLWIRSENENKKKLIGALEEFGISAKDLKKLTEVDFNTAQAFHIGKEPERIDFLTQVAGISFEEAYKQKALLPLKDKQIPVIHYDHLIINKMISGRSRDKIDVEELQKINKYKKRKNK